SGAPSARNQGVQKCDGDYIQFLDADDIIKPEKIEAQIELAEKSDYPELVVGSYKRENANKKVVKTCKYSDSKNYHIWLQLMQTDLGITSSNLFKASSFRKGLKWNESLKSSQEYDLMFHLLKNGARVAYDDAQNTIIRERSSGSISQVHLSEKWERYVKLRADILKYRIESKDPQVESLLQSMFIAIRMLYPYNPISALNYYFENIPKNFIPATSASITKGYVKSYRLLGFEKTEKLRGVIRANKAG
ncbi:MAG: glycosyltransferase, partial [Bacteroidota bacterium]